MAGDELSPVFVVGAQRSGTTALAAAVAGAFEAAGHSFSVNARLPLLLQRWCTDSDLAGRHFRADEVAASLAAYGPARYPPGWRARATAALDAAAERAAAGSPDGDAVAEARRIRVEAYTASGGGQWGDKYNEYLLELDHLHRLFPAARWVFVARRPADVVASMLAWDKDRSWHPRHAAACADKWAWWNEQWLRFRRRVPARRRVELDYGRLCAGDHGVLDRILGLPVAPHLAGYRPRPARPSTAVALTERARAAEVALAAAGILPVPPARATAPGAVTTRVAGPRREEVVP